MGKNNKSCFTGATGCNRKAKKECQLQPVEVTVDFSAICNEGGNDKEIEQNPNQKTTRDETNIDNNARKSKQASLLKNILNSISRTVEPVVNNEDASEVTVNINVPPIADDELKEVLDNIFAFGLTVAYFSGSPIAIPAVLLNPKVRANIKTVHDYTTQSILDSINPFSKDLDQSVSATGNIIGLLPEKNMGINLKGKSLSFKLYNTTFNGNKYVKVLGNTGNVGKLLGHAGTILSLPEYQKSIENAESPHEVTKLWGGKTGEVVGAFVGAEVGAVAGGALVGCLVAAGVVAGSAVVVPALIVGACGIIGGAAIGALGKWAGEGVGENTGKLIEHFI